MYSQFIKEANLKFNNKFIYVEPEKFIKVGLTKHKKVKYRFRGYKDYKISVLYEWDLDFLTAYDIEQAVLNKFKEYSYKPLYKFKGHTEVLKYDILDATLSVITEML